MPRDPERLLDMLNAAKRITRRLDGVTRDDFNADDDLQIIIVYLIQIIGEAARNISGELQADRPDIAWHEIIAMRHRIVHDYLNINVAKVWETAIEDIPALISMIEPLVPPEEPAP
jgi:uncharacterized protein with HEPN domain